MPRTRLDTSTYAHRMACVAELDARAAAMTALANEIAARGLESVYANHARAAATLAREQAQALRAITETKES